MMNSIHHKMEKRMGWYNKWHKDKLSIFVHYFVLIVFVLAFIFNYFAAFFETRKAMAAFNQIPMPNAAMSKVWSLVMGN